MCKNESQLRQSIKKWRERVAISRLEMSVTTILEFSGDLHDLNAPLSELCLLIHETRKIDAVDGLIPCLVKLARQGDDASIKSKALQCLSSLAAVSLLNKELIVGAAGIDLTVMHLAGESTELRVKGLTLLLELCKDSQFWDILGRTEACIPLLSVIASNGTEEVANMAQLSLKHLSGSLENLKRLTRANHFEPLLEKLKEGSIEEKVAMASLLGELNLTDYSRATLKEKGVLPYLVDMLTSSTGNYPALEALQNLVTHPSVREALLETDVVRYILDLLKKCDSFINRHQEMAVSILANLVMPTAECFPDIKAHRRLSILLSNVHVLIALFAITRNSRIKNQLIQIFFAVTFEGAIKERQLTAYLIQHLLHTYREMHVDVKLNAIKLLSSLVETDNGAHFVEPQHVKNFVIALSDSPAVETIEVLKFLSKLPIHAPQTMSMLVRAGALQAVMRLLCRQDINSLRHRAHLVESALGVLLLYTQSPSVAVLELLSSSFATTSALVSILEEGTPLAKKRAAMALAHLSSKTMDLSRPLGESNAGLLDCWMRPKVNTCMVHGKVCSAKETFCLVEAGAVSPLVKMLELEESSADAGAVEALGTLLVEETWTAGMRTIEEAQGLVPMVKLLTKGSLEAQRKVLFIIQKLTAYREYCSLIETPEQCALICLMQQGESPINKEAAKILGNLGVIPQFSASSSDSGPLRTMRF